MSKPAIDTTTHPVDTTKASIGTTLVGSELLQAEEGGLPPLLTWTLASLVNQGGENQHRILMDCDPQLSINLPSKMAIVTS